MGFFKNIKNIQKAIQQVESAGKSKAKNQPSGSTAFAGYHADPDYTTIQKFNTKEEKMRANKCSECGQRKLRMFQSKEDKDDYIVVCICGKMGGAGYDVDGEDGYEEALGSWNQNNPE